MLAALGLTLQGGAPGAAATALDGPSAALQDAQVQPGGAVAYTAAGFPAGATLHVTVGGDTALDEQQVDGDGAATGSFALPESVTAGSHELCFGLVPPAGPCEGVTVVLLVQEAVVEPSTTPPATVTPTAGAAMGATPTSAPSSAAPAAPTSAAPGAVTPGAPATASTPTRGGATPTATPRPPEAATPTASSAAPPPAGTAQFHPVATLPPLSGAMAVGRLLAPPLPVAPAPQLAPVLAPEVAQALPEPPQVPVTVVAPAGDRAAEPVLVRGGSEPDPVGIALVVLFGLGVATAARVSGRRARG